jgi:hypothetical protein
LLSGVTPLQHTTAKHATPDESSTPPAARACLTLGHTSTFTVDSPSRLKKPAQAGFSLGQVRKPDGLRKGGRKKMVRRCPAPESPGLSASRWSH